MFAKEILMLAGELFLGKAMLKIAFFILVGIALATYVPSIPATIKSWL